MLFFWVARNGPISHAITVNFVDFLYMNIYNLFTFFLILLIMLLSKIILKELLSQEVHKFIVWFEFFGSYERLFGFILFVFFIEKKILLKKVIVKTITKCNKLKHKRPISIKYLHMGNFSHFKQGVNNVHTLMLETRKLLLCMNT